MDINGNMQREAITILHLGDISKIDGHNVPRVHIITGGSPCQDLSCAGKRAGLAGERSGLFMEQVRIVKQMRDASKQELISKSGENYDKSRIIPRYMIWENVCFVSDTQIVTINGLKSIQDVQVGDQVLTHKHRYMPVVETYVHTDKEVVQVNIIGGQPLICTPNHPIYGCKKNSDGSYGELEFIPAGLLTSNHKVASFWNDKIAYKAVESVIPLNKKETVYNLSVLEDNTYVANSIICHNCGAYSSGNPGGSDFQAVLEEICKVVRHDCPIVPIPKDGWPLAGNLDGVGDDGTPFSICWRTHDAQYWGVPQRRRRIALVADFGGTSAPEILFESNSLSGNTQESRKEGQGTTTDVERSVGETSAVAFEPGAASRVGGHVYENKAGSLRANAGDNQQAVAYRGDAITSPINASNPQPGDPCHTLTADDRNYVVQPDAVGCDIYNSAVTGDVAASLTAQGSLSAGGSGPSVIINTSDSCIKQEPVLLESNQNHATIQTDGISTALPASMGEGGGYVPMVAIEGNGTRDSHKGDGYAETETMYTLNTVEQHAVAYAVESHAQDARYNVGDTNQTLGANMEHDPANGGPVLCSDVHGFQAGGAGVNEGCVVQSTVYSIDQGAGKSGCNFDVNKAPTLTTTHGGEPVVLNDQGGDNAPLVFGRQHDVTDDDITPSLCAKMGTGGNNVPMVMEPVSIGNGQTNQSIGNKAGSLNCMHDQQAIITNGQKIIGNQYVSEGKVIIQETRGPGAVFENHSQDTRYRPLGETCQTVTAGWEMRGNNQPLVVEIPIVRRLTPLECERLQGFPDYWTHIGDWVDSKGKKHKDSDSPKYKALGNSIALPFWYWMAGRMVAQLKKSGVEHPTMASLFDGIAGFPYVYIRHGCMPLWTSEIEEFPMAVCRKHFGDEETGEVGDIGEYLKLPPNWKSAATSGEGVTDSTVAFDRATFNQGANAKYDFSVEQGVAQTLLSRGPGGVCQ